MKRHSAVLLVLLGARLLTTTGLSLSRPFPFVWANERLDTGLQDLSTEIRANIVSYESWDATARDGTQKVVVNRITYSKGTPLNLDAATEGVVEDIMTGLENACKPQYQINCKWWQTCWDVTCPSNAICPSKAPFMGSR